MSLPYPFSFWVITEQNGNAVERSLYRWPSGTKSPPKTLSPVLKGDVNRKALHIHVVHYYWDTSCIWLRRPELTNSEDGSPSKNADVCIQLNPSPFLSPAFDSSPSPSVRTSFWMAPKGIMAKIRNQTRKPSTEVVPVILATLSSLTGLCLDLLTCSRQTEPTCQISRSEVKNYCNDTHTHIRTHCFTWSTKIK